MATRMTRIGRINAAFAFGNAFYNFYVKMIPPKAEKSALIRSIRVIRVPVKSL